MSSLALHEPPNRQSLPRDLVMENESNIPQDFSIYDARRRQKVT